MGLEVVLADTLGHSLVLVTGATGAVGPLVVAAFHEAGYRVRTLSLSFPSAVDWPDDVEIMTGDVTDLAVVQRAVQGVDAVVHLAALLHVVNPPLSLRERYERINVGGTANVVAGACRAGVRRIVFFSTIAVYGSSSGGFLTEEATPQPVTLYARTKLTAERAVLEARDPDGRPIGVVLRLGSVYGSRVKGNYRTLARLLARGRFIPLGSGANRRTLIYDRDVVSAALLATTHPDAGGRVFNVTDGQVHTVKAIIATLCAALGRRPPRLVLPVGPVRGLVGFVETGARICGVQPPLTRVTIDTYTEDVAVAGERFRKELGFVPQYDLAAGWRETVARMRQAGEL